MSMIDDMLALQTALPKYRASIARRRALLVRDVEERYGVALHQHPRKASVVVVSATDYDELRACVTNDSGLDAVGRGYYSYLGGELDVNVAPDWTCDPLALSWLRLRVSLLDRPIRRLLRALTR